ncbi:hypothetical protein DMENIID0001_013980 [Sergentomyia squamirostris]
MVWSRSENLKFPQIWYTFEAKDPDTGNIVTYRVEDLTEDRFEEVEHLMKTIFIRDEDVCKSVDAVNDLELTAARIRYIKTVLDQKISLVCFKKGSYEICGFNLLEVLEKETEEKRLRESNQVMGATPMTTQDLRYEDLEKNDPYLKLPNIAWPIVKLLCMQIME